MYRNDVVIRELLMVFFIFWSPLFSPILPTRDGSLIMFHVVDVFNDRTRPG